jgi:hypothetical protein
MPDAQFNSRVEHLIAGAPWRATSHVAPHEYVMEHWSPELAELVAQVRSRIRNEGYWRQFRGCRYPTVHIGTHYYWTMQLDYPEVVDGRRPGGPICLNRAQLPVSDSPLGPAVTET